MFFIEAFLSGNVKNVQSTDVAHAWTTMDIQNTSAIFILLLLT